MKSSLSCGAVLVITSNKQLKIHLFPVKLKKNSIARGQPGGIPPGFKTGNR